VSSIVVGSFIVQLQAESSRIKKGVKKNIFFIKAILMQNIFNIVLSKATAVSTGRGGVPVEF
jgi:hypothetical protein